MAYTTEEGRKQLVDDVIGATRELARSLACLSEAYEALDEDGADIMEARMFRPVQVAYGRLRRAHTEFAARHRLPAREFPPGSPGTQSADPRVFIERAVQATQDADQRIADLQDSLRPVEVGDPELRAGLSETRALVAEVPAAGRQLLRGIGR
jgi:hypothetical protein